MARIECGKPGFPPPHLNLTPRPPSAHRPRARGHHNLSSIPPSFILFWFSGKTNQTSATWESAAKLRTKAWCPGVPPWVAVVLTTARSRAPGRTGMALEGAGSHGGRDHVAGGGQAYGSGGSNAWAPTPGAGIRSARLLFPLFAVLTLFPCGQINHGCSCVLSDDDEGRRWLVAGTLRRSTIQFVCDSSTLWRLRQSDFHPVIGSCFHHPVHAWDR